MEFKYTVSLKTQYFVLMSSLIKRRITPYELLFLHEKCGDDESVFYTQSRIDRLRTLVEEGL